MTESRHPRTRREVSFDERMSTCERITPLLHSLRCPAPTPKTARRPIKGFLRPPHSQGDHAPRDQGTCDSTPNPVPDAHPLVHAVPPACVCSIHPRSSIARQPPPAALNPHLDVHWPWRMRVMCERVPPVPTPTVTVRVCLLKCLHDGVSWAERIAISLALYVTLRGYAMLPPTRVWRKTGFALARRLETVQQLLAKGQ